MSVDIPMSFLNPDQIELSDIQKEAVDSIDKLNMLAYSLKDGTDEELKETEALKKTLEDKFTKKTSDDCSVVLLSTEHIEGYMDKVIKNVVNFFSKSTRFKIF